MTSITTHAVELIHSAEEFSADYVRSRPATPETSEVRSACEYTFIVSALRWIPDYFGSPVKPIVAEALRLRFGMSDEEFATTILRG